MLWPKTFSILNKHDFFFLFFVEFVHLFSLLSSKVIGNRLSAHFDITPIAFWPFSRIVKFAKCTIRGFKVQTSL